MKSQNSTLYDEIIGHASKYCSKISVLTGTHRINIKKIPIEIKKVKKSQYSALAYPNKIVLSIPEAMDVKMKKELSAILTHEYFHICIENNDKLKRIIKKCLDENIDFIKSLKIKKLTSWLVLNELIVSSFVPEGYIGQLMGYDTHYKETTIMGSIRLSIGKIMFNTAKRYVLKRKIIDEAYIDTIIKKLKTRSSI